jgi:uncharacterized protein
MIAWLVVMRMVRLDVRFGGILACVALLGLGSYAPAGCKSSVRLDPPPTAREAPTVAIDTGAAKHTFKVELALTAEEHARGLMYRRSLAPDAGMLFVFDGPRPQAFWMQNTFIPLDMVFIGEDRRIVGIVENAEPLTTMPRRVEGDSQYVLEIGGGLAARLGIRAGQRVELPKLR